jgi:hypothetical protein
VDGFGCLLLSYSGGFLYLLPFLVPVVAGGRAGSTQAPHVPSASDPLAAHCIESGQERLARQLLFERICVRGLQ